MKRRILVLGVGAAVAVIVLLLLGQVGFPVPFVFAWMILAIAVVCACRQEFIEVGPVWPPEKPSRKTRGSEVARMAWAINTRTGVAGHVVVRRVQSVLRRRLALRGLDLDDPTHHARIDALLGGGVRDALHGREVRSTDIEIVLDAIERIPNDTEETG
ncbi:hypothetical protein [Microbacterium sp.]|uniref:hypothetical protein n=1 Tax=unclassified Microbacterium TaxID=2609290 RepID=UPI0026023D0E|nr:hypothetical protein [Microbacterium sp.]